MKWPKFLTITSAVLGILAAGIPVMARNTGLVIDARGVPLARSMSPKILVESGREIYGTVPRNAPREIMEKQSFLYARSIEEAKAEDPGRLGANPLMIRASGARLADVIVSDADAGIIAEEEKTGGFLKNQNVVVLIGAPDIGASPLESGEGESSLRETLEVRLKMARDRREALKAGRPVEPGPGFSDTLSDTTPGAASVPAAGEAGVKVYKYNPNAGPDGWEPPQDLVATGSTSGSSTAVAAYDAASGSGGPKVVAPGEILLASIVKIKGNKIILQRMDDAGSVRINSKFRIYKSILRDTSVGWLKVTGAEGREVRARLLEGEGKVKIGDYIDLNEVNTIDSYIESLKN